jgi:hypothetical protein
MTAHALAAVLLIAVVGRLRDPAVDDLLRARRGAVDGVEVLTVAAVASVLEPALIGREASRPVLGDGGELRGPGQVGDA